MKLTVNKDNKVIFDYSDVDMNAKITSPDYLKTKQCEKFLFGTDCVWEHTQTPQVDVMSYSRNMFGSIIQDANLYKRYLTDCECKALYCYQIEVTEEFISHLRDVENDCKVMWEHKIAEQNELKELQRYERFCRNGCEGCENLCYILDQPVCNKTGKELQERNQPVFAGNAYKLFNLVPLPSPDCPLKPATPRVYAPAPAFQDLFPLSV